MLQLKKPQKIWMVQFLKLSNRTVTKALKLSKQTISPVNLVSSNSDSNTQIDFKAGMHQDGRKTKQFEEGFPEKRPLRGTTGNRKPSCSSEKKLFMCWESCKIT